MICTSLHQPRGSPLQVWSVLIPVRVGGLVAALGRQGRQTGRLEARSFELGWKAPLYVREKGKTEKSSWGESEHQFRIAAKLSRKVVRDIHRFAGNCLKRLLPK